MKILSSRTLSDHGMVLVLLLLCGYYTFATIKQQYPSGLAAADEVGATLAAKAASNAQVLVVAGSNDEDHEFADSLGERIAQSGLSVAAIVKGSPGDVRRKLVELDAQGIKLEWIGCTHKVSSWAVLGSVEQKYGSFDRVNLVSPQSYYWPDFLKLSNLLNVANQIAVIAIIAIGMTMVIVTAGIDLSVGSLIALSAVVAARLMRDYGGGTDAGVTAMVLCSFGGILICTASGAFSGIMITAFRVPPFIVTLGMMMVASGLAYKISDSQSINDVPDSFTWLGRGVDLIGIPNAVVLMVILYAVAHVLMTRTALGRYIYAVGGNVEAARLSGVPVKRVLIFVYMLCGALAGLGGIVTASLLKSGAPTYGQLGELRVIAAVVVGGTSLSGGDGRVLGTLVGAFIIAVNDNGMNLTNIDSSSQRIVLGVVILGAVLLDQVRKHGMSFSQWTSLGLR